MTFTVDAQLIITLASVIAALTAIITFFVKIVKWVERQKLQDTEIASIKSEQTLIVYGLLACLKGLAEQGCDGPVHDAIDKIEKHLNQKAHE